MNLAELRAAFRVDCDDLADGKLTRDVDLDRWLNEAEQEACTRKDLLFEAEHAMCEVEVSTSERRVKISDRWVYLTYGCLQDPALPTTLRELDLTSRAQMDATRPGWRRQVCEPYALITYDGAVEVVGRLDRTWTLVLEGYRLPLKAMAARGDSPEISGIHHRHLVHWALHRAYAVPDAEIFNPDKSAKALAEFERYFGLRPDADLRRDQQADQPHHNKAW